MPRHPIGVILLARLGVDRSVQGRGVGSWLLADAMRRSVAAPGTGGHPRADGVHAIDERARAFYSKHGLRSSSTDPQHLMILIKDIRAALEEIAKPA